MMKEIEMNTHKNPQSILETARNKCLSRADFDEGVKACAAIKDAEIAELKLEIGDWKLTADANFNSGEAVIKQQKAEIAARDLMIKELRDELLEKAKTALFYGECSINERNPKVGSKNEGIARMMEHAQNEIQQALAKSEHHNSRALEKMLLEAELKGLATPDFEFVEKHNDIRAKLAELNKE